MWPDWLRFLLLVFLPFVGGKVEVRNSSPILLPIEVLGEGGTTVCRPFLLSKEQGSSAKSMRLQIHELRYAGEASVRINQREWIPLRNDTVTIDQPDRSFGGIGGGFDTLDLSLPLMPDSLEAGTNVVCFRFNRSDGLASGYRVLALNFLSEEGRAILSPADFVDDTPATWLPPLADQSSIQSGEQLWLHASLIANGLPGSPRIRANCADCHTRDGRDLKYFNFSNLSIIARARFHGLTTLEGEQIASYIRNLPYTNPGRPWNPPYQPGPGLDRRPVSAWAAGAGLAWVLKSDTQALPYFLDRRLRDEPESAPPPIQSADSLAALEEEVHPEVFDPDGNLDAREIPTAMQLPDWNDWLPRIHPKDAWGSVFEKSEFAEIYDSESRDSQLKASPLAGKNNSEIATVQSALGRWSKARREFLGRFVKRETVWSPELTNKVYSTQLWQLTKTWEMTQDFGLEEHRGNTHGLNGESRVWMNAIPASTAPAAVGIVNGPDGVGGSSLTNEYSTASWYELQVILNSGNHQHRDRTPVDWVYLVGEFRDLYTQSQQPEPTRLLIAVTKALQSSDPRRGPEDYSRGWRPDQNVDPRIMVSPNWNSTFQPLPVGLRQRLTVSMLSAWMDKNLQYPIQEYLPLGSLQDDYKARIDERDISGGKVWTAAEQFRTAGVGADLIDQLLKWGTAYADRAARIQYH